MRIDFTRQFRKQYSKLNPKIQDEFDNRLKHFMQLPFSHHLRNHKLSGKYKGFYSINITGDIRAVYKIDTDKTYIFTAIGTHSELY